MRGMSTKQAQALSIATARIPIAKKLHLMHSEFSNAGAAAAFLYSPQDNHET